MGEDGGGKKTGNWEINCKLHSMCVVWAKTRRFQSREDSGGSIRVFVPMAHIGWCWFTYSWVWGIHI